MLVPVVISAVFALVTVRAVLHQCREQQLSSQRALSYVTACSSMRHRPCPYNQCAHWQCIQYDNRRRKLISTNHLVEQSVDLAYIEAVQHIVRLDKLMGKALGHLHVPVRSNAILTRPRANSLTNHVGSCAFVYQY